MAKKIDSAAKMIKEDKKRKKIEKIMKKSGKDSMHNKVWDYKKREYK